MATCIRLARHGTKKRPFYRIVVQDRRAPRDGRFIEHIGHYNPIAKEGELHIDRARLEYWLSTGAQTTETVYNLIKPLFKSLAKSEAANANQPTLSRSSNRHTETKGPKES